MEIEMILGHIGNIGFFYGAIAFSRKHISAWYAQIIANIFYVIQAILMNNSSILILSIVLIGVNIYGLWKWSKLRPKTNLDQERNHAEHSYVVEMMKEKEGYL